MLFRSARDQRTFLTILLTYALDLVGYSIVFPVLAPLLLNPNLHFFAAGTSLAERTTMLGLLYAVFGVSQFFGSPAIGALADHYGRYKSFLGSIGFSIIGYAVMAVSIYMQSIALLFVGRTLTGFCSGNFALAQSATADLTDAQHRSKAFSILLGVGGLGFVAGPWIGGRLANPDWLSGSGAFIFASIAALINLIMIFFFFTETSQSHGKHTGESLFKTFKDMRIVFHQVNLRKILITTLLLNVGWGFFLIFSPTFLVQRFSLGADQIGDIFAYMAVVWFFATMFLNKELSGKVPLRTLVLIGLPLAIIGIFAFLLPSTLWPYWIVIPIALTGGALSWVNLGSILSLRAPPQLQGRVLGASGSTWSIGQIVAPLVAGPLAGWNLYSPLFVGAVIIVFALGYFALCYKE